MRLLRIAALAMGLPMAAIAQSVPVGDWAGLGHQNGDTWTMEVQIAQGGARVDYPSLSCGGIWQFLPEHDDLRAIEWLTYGHALCLDALHVTMEPTKGGGLMIRWYDDTEQEIAFAPLDRIAPQRDKARKN